MMGFYIVTLICSMVTATLLIKAVLSKIPFSEESSMWIRLTGVGMAAFGVCGVLATPFIKAFFIEPVHYLTLYLGGTSFLTGGNLMIRDWTGSDPDKS